MRSASACPSPAATCATYPSGSTTTSVGHAFTAYSCHSRMSGSLTTGWSTPWRATAAATDSASPSRANFGEWTPIVTSTSANSRSSGRSSSRTCRQFTQPEVQKSSSTTRPRSAANVSGLPSVLNQTSPVNSGARTGARFFAALTPPVNTTGVTGIPPDT